MGDMLVKLYDLPDYTPLFEKLKAEGYKLCRPLACDRYTVENWVKEAFPGWDGEVSAAFAKETPSLYIATKNQKVVGFACYHATAKDFFGPIGVAESERGHSLGIALLGKCMLAMEAEGYGYAIIGWTELENYYAKACNAIPIPDSTPGVYGRLIQAETYFPEMQ